MRQPIPKPTKKERKQEEKGSHQDLVAYRYRMYALAEARDGGQCVPCFFLEHRSRNGSAHHHVFGRDQVAGGWREHYTNILCVCDEHHADMPPIQTPGASKNLSWIEELVMLANLYPINQKFAHTFTGMITDVYQA